MRDIAPVLDRWLSARPEDGAASRTPLALATVTRTWGSGPRRPGARMTIGPAAEIAGSVSGGCVEANVIEAAREVLASGKPRLLDFAVADELAWGVGLACGGALSVFVEPADPGAVAAARAGMEARQPVAWAVCTGGEHAGKGAVFRGGERRFLSPGAAEAAEALGSVAAQSLAAGTPQSAETPAGPVFCDVVLPPETLVMVGGVHIAQSLARLADTLGYRPVLCDPRPVFASESRFPGVEIVREWPEQAFAAVGLDAGCAVAALTHDPKLDDPALRSALDSPAFYVGALGSRGTHRRRLARLREAGVPEERLARLRAPIGLPIGARSPDQIALSIMAEVVAARNGALPAVPAPRSEKPRSEEPRPHEPPSDERGVGRGGAGPRTRPADS